MDSMLRSIKQLIPRPLFLKLQPLYHMFLALLAGIVYGFPSKEIKIVAVTGTKGKTSTAELINSILESAGFKTALAGTLRFKIGKNEEPNLFKMTMPGRFFMQRFLKNAVKEKCQWAVIEMTSEGAKQFRHKFIELDALVFTNLSKEHIESHGSYEKYRSAKLKLAEALSTSTKRDKSIIVNGDDKESELFLKAQVDNKHSFHLRDAGAYKLLEKGVELIFQGEKINSPLHGLFNVYNIMAAATFAKSQGIEPSKIKAGIENVKEIRGRAQEIKFGQPFSVIVDYAHTPDSLRAIYSAYERKRKICVLGNTGGGRDKWKRSEMGKIADKWCDKIILTNEDPYDEDPGKIVDDMAKAIEKHPAEIIMDRREAITKALSYASQDSDAVIITGKGTDPYIMGPSGTKTPWSDSRVAEEEIKRLAK